MRQHLLELPPSSTTSLAPSPPPRLPRVALPRRHPPPSSPKKGTSPPPPSAALTSPSTWLYLTATLSRECATAEDDLVYILRSHSGWSDLLEGLQQSERQCLADRQQLAKEVSGLRGLMAPPREGGVGASREEVLAALKEYRERQRHSYAALCGEERALLHALSSSSKLLSLPLPPPNTAAAATPPSGMAVEMEEEEGKDGEEREEDGVPRKIPTTTSPPGKDNVDGEEGVYFPPPASSPQPPPTLQQRYDAVRARVAALDSEEASVGPGVLGWDPLDKKKGGAEDAARFTSALNQFMAAAATTTSCSQLSGSAGGEGEGQLTPGEEEAFLARVATLLPGREEGALRKFLAGALRAKARRKEKMAALGEWKALRVALQRAAAAGYTGSGGGGVDTSFSSSSSSSPHSYTHPTTTGSSTWVGPDALARIAVVEWRASKEAEKAQAAAEAEALAAAASLRAKVERDAWIQTQRNSLTAWQQQQQQQQEGLNETATARRHHHHHHAPPTPPPPAPLDPLKALAVQARSAAAEQAAAARRKAVEGKKAATEAAAAARRGDGRVAEAIERVGGRGGGLRSAALFFGGGGASPPSSSPLSPGGESSSTTTTTTFIPPPLPERPTNASVSHALTKRELREREVVRERASAHERALPSVKPLARGKAFGIGAFGALPTRAVPAWRKKL